MNAALSSLTNARLSNYEYKLFISPKTGYVNWTEAICCCF